MTSVSGSMTTDRPERYASQLFSHWSEHGPVTTEGDATVQRWNTGQVVALRPIEGALEVEVSVPDGDDAARFAQVVKAHLERFGRREELTVVWHV